MRIDFLIHHVYAMGGTIRTVLNLAPALAARHDVRIVSVFRRRDTSFFDLPRSVRVTSLVDQRDGNRKPPRGAQPSAIFPAGEVVGEQYSSVTDEAIIGYLRDTDADAVIGTRPGLNFAVAGHCRPGVLRLGQEHRTFTSYPAKLVPAIAKWYPRLDGLSVLTGSDAAGFAQLLPAHSPTIRVLPNAVPPSPLPPAELDAPIVIAVGRLLEVKRFDLLIEAFSLLLEREPHWRLRIYGTGRVEPRLRKRIEDLGLYNEAQLMGRTPHPYEELAKASIAAMSSSHEGLPTFLIEAMAAGLPVASFDCPVGPRELIREGENGLLVPPLDTRALADALAVLAADRELRRAMGSRGIATASQFEPASVAEQWEGFLEDLQAKQRRPSS